MKPTVEKLDALIDHLKYSGLAKLVRLGLPWVSDINKANERILELECLVIRLQAEIDRQKMVRLWDEC